MDTILDVKNYSKEFNLHILNNKKIKALEQVSFSLKEGEIIGLVGKSGSGKSTLMKSIYRTYLASSGEIWFKSSLFGSIEMVSAGDHHVIALRKKEITFCSQFLSVIPRITAVDVVANNLISRGVPQAEARKRSAACLEALGLPKELWDAYPSTFSGGEQQRVNVAQAIIAKPRLLLIDEPTASLDPKTKDIVIDMILSLKKNNTSVLCISHDSYTLNKMCDRLIELKDGKILGETLVGITSNN
ncbi:phosphonate C-P lyase system protein PhnL [Aquiflexum sp.]|uniref:phosphonate C-P lyase system protein PhnL n=1 Tax=Aquiflexum sp. TaxID=1872584 RepID=UPI003592FA99